jgi:hypothetical protein
MRHSFAIIAVTGLSIAGGQALLAQVAGGVATGSGFGVASGAAAIGPNGFSFSSHGDNTGTVFTYNSAPGATVFVQTGAPYAGRNSSQTVRTLANGTHLTQPSFKQPMTYRDTMGRTRQDRPVQQMPGLPGAEAQDPSIALVEIVDPVAGYRYVLDPVHHVAHRMAIQVRQNRPVQPAVALTAPAISLPPQTMANGATMSSESLGTQTMFGVTVAGMRMTTTYPAGTFQGNDQPVVMVNESWRSLQHNIVLLSKNTGPNGDTTMTMLDFSAEEPDPALFQIPAGYQIVDETGQFTITIPRSSN